MKTVKEEIKVQFQQALSDLQQLRDEVRVKLHLGGMEAKQKWQELEPRLRRVEAEAERASGEAAESLRDMVTDLKHAFADLRKTLD